MNQKITLNIDLKKTLKYGLITVAISIIGLVIVYMVFINNFTIFGESEKRILKTKWDYEGLRQATLFEYIGNAATMPSFIVPIDFGDPKSSNGSNEHIVLTAEKAGVAMVNIEWNSFDTLTISLAEGLKPITMLDKVIYPDSSLNVNIEYVTK